jgi:hypothetical protein
MIVKCFKRYRRLSRMMRRYLAVALVLALAATFLCNPVTVKAEGTTVIWTGGAETSDWHTPGNWNPAKVPADGDIVKIPEFSVVECANADVTVTLDCAGTLTVSGGTLNLTGTSYLKNGKLDGAGSIAVTGEGSQLIWQGGDIRGTGSFTVETDAKLKVEFLTTKDLNRPLSCVGTIDLNAGTLRLSGGGQVGGQVVLAQGTVLKFVGDDYTINGSLSETRTGASLDVDGGNVVFNGAYNIKNTTIKGGATASWNVNTHMPLLSVKGAATFHQKVSVDVLIFQSGSIDGSGDITLMSEGNKSWSGGSFEGDGELIIEAGSPPTNLSVSGSCSLSRSLTNNSHLMISSGGSLDLLGGAGGTGGFNIQDGGSLRLGGPGSYSLGSATGQVTNNGQLIISDTCTEVKLNTWLSQQSATGILAFDIGQGGRFCKLEINNQALINGSQLKINLADGFVPADGATFEVMTYTSRSGSFAGITSNAEDVIFEPTYGGTSLTLTAKAALEQAAAPTAVPAAGTYTETKNVELATATEGATIYYTIDGSNPTTESTPYTVPIAVKASMTIKAIAVKAGMDDSQVAEFIYVIEAADKVPPAWSEGFPKAVDVTTSGFTLQAKIDEAGTAYYVVLSDEAGAPSAAQVKAGQDSNGNPMAEGRKGQISLTADTEGSTSISGLASETAYDIYVVAEDTANNLQTIPAKLDITTLKVLSGDAEITAYSFAQQTGDATIDSAARTIDIEVQNGTDVTSLVAAFTLSSGASTKVGGVSQVSGTTANDFTEPVVYIVTAEDGTTTKAWTVTVTEAAPTEFAGGNGTEDNPYLVATAAQLNNVRNHLDKYFKQIANIDLNVAPYNVGEGWLPIGTLSQGLFIGSFDGNGFAIRNIYINRPDSSDVGLFGYSKGVIRNVKLENVNTTGKDFVGSLVGRSEGQIQIEDSSATGSVQGHSAVGGLVGFNYNGAITSCFTECTVTGNNVGELKSYGVGGLVGNTSGNSLTCQIADCYANGTVIGEDSVGGLAGYSGNAIANSYATGTVTGKTWVGGLVGTNRTRITDSYSTCTVSGERNVGGLVGYNYGDSGPFIEDCHATGAVTGNEYVGGLVGYSGMEFGSIKRSFATGSVTGGSHVGGLVGENQNRVSDCHYTGDTVKGEYAVGGLVGSNTGAIWGDETFPAIVERSYATASVVGIAEIEGGTRFGGLVGYNEGTITSAYAVGSVTGKTWVGGLVGSNAGAISQCFASGAVEGSEYSIGGLVGNNYMGGSVVDCYALGAVHGISQVGGLVGWNPSGSITRAYSTGQVTGTTSYGGLIGEGVGGCTKSYWDTETSGQARSAGGSGNVVGKTSAEMKQRGTYVDWDFTDIWDIDSGKNNGYPFLRDVTVEEPAAPSTEANITAFSFSLSDGVTINYVAHTVDVLVDSGTDVTNLVATFALSSRASAAVGSDPQISGVTTNNFTDPVVYTVTAEDGTTKDWTVRVTKRKLKQESGEPLWYYRSPWPTTKVLWEVKFVNNKFMAVGEKGALAISDNGELWGRMNSGIEDTLKGVAYGNGKYIAVGYSKDDHGVIYGSDVGVDWSRLATIYDYQLTDIIYENGKFVAVGQGGKIVTSSDGMTWEVRKAIGIQSLMHSITHGNGTYVAVGAEGRIASSPDGENWIARGPVVDTLQDIAYGNGIFVAVGGYTTGCIYSSVDKGVTWTEYTFPQTCYTRFMTVEYDGNHFVAAGNKSDGTNPAVFTSTNGTSWTRQSGFPSDARFSAAAAGKGKYVAVGGYGDVLTSTDGATWTRLTLGTNKDLLDVASSGSVFVSVGKDGIIQSSPDALLWTVRSSGTNEWLWSVEHLDGKFIAVGDKGVVLTSDDGITWAKPTSGTSERLLDATYGNGKYVAVGGVRAASTTSVILFSTDSITWNPATHGCKIPFMTVTYGNGIFIALADYGQVYTSTDGENWSKTADILGYGYPQDIIYADGRFIATGGYGEIYISDDDGATWTVHTKVDGVEQNIYSVAYGGGDLVAVTGYGKILVSSDKGDTWSQQPSGLDQELHLFGVIAGGSNFIAVGERGLTLQSKDFDTPGDPDADAVASDMAALTWENIRSENIRQDSVTGNLVNPLPTTGASETDISWSASPTGRINITTGEVTRPAYAEGDQTVTLTATISKGTASANKAFDLTIKAAELTPDEAIALDLTALTWDVIKGSNSSQDKVTYNLVLPTNGVNDTTISWAVSPDDGSINTATGKVTRPAAGEGSKAVTLTATVSKEGGQSRTTEFKLTIMAMASPGTGSGGGSSITTYTISVTAGNGGTITPKTIKVVGNASQTFTITPDSGYEIEDVMVDGKSIGAMTSYTFKKVTGSHTISATFKKVEEIDEEVPDVELSFKDVYETDWFFNSVKFAYENGLMAGTAVDYFSPQQDTSRGMIVTILYRLEKTPAATTHTFSDVDLGTWYNDAVAWAVANGIVQGYGDNLFGPDDSITREQMACILYRYAKYAGHDMLLPGQLGQVDVIAGFVDGATTSEWALEAMRWAVEIGMINGKGNDTLDPTGTATRAEIAAILQRLIESNAK